MSQNVEHKIVGSDDDGSRLDRWFKKYVPLMRHGQLEKALRKGQIRVDGTRIKASTRVRAGQSIRIPPFEALSVGKTPVRRPASLNLQLVSELRERVLYMDDHVQVLDKPAGLAVQGGTNTKKHVDGALSGLKFGAAEKPRLVHRLDKDTSGVLVLGRTAQAARVLTLAFKSRDAHKVYWALTVGVPDPPDGCIRAPLRKRPGHSGERVVVTDDGKYAETDYEVLDQAGRRTALVAMRPRTGRTHQLRVHCADVLETPILGDGKYAGQDAFIDGISLKALQLHARSIDIAHPAGGRLKVEAPLPAEMLKTIKFFGFDHAAFADPFTSR